MVNTVANRRPAAGAGGAGSRPSGNPGVLRLYTDDAPGLKIGPTTVLVMSLMFVGCVILLHIWGKFRG